MLGRYEAICSTRGEARYLETTRQKRKRCVYASGGEATSSGIYMKSRGRLVCYTRVRGTGVATKKFLLITTHVNRRTENNRSELKCVCSTSHTTT